MELEDETVSTEDRIKSSKQYKMWETIWNRVQELKDEHPEHTILQNMEGEGQLNLFLFNTAKEIIEAKKTNSNGPVHQKRKRSENNIVAITINNGSAVTTNSKKAKKQQKTVENIQGNKIQTQTPQTKTMIDRAITPSSEIFKRRKVRVRYTNRNNCETIKALRTCQQKVKAMIRFLKRKLEKQEELEDKGKVKEEQTRATKAKKRKTEPQIKRPSKITLENVTQKREINKITEYFGQNQCTMTNSREMNKKGNNRKRTRELAGGITEFVCQTHKRVNHLEIKKRRTINEKSTRTGTNSRKLRNIVVVQKIIKNSKKRKKKTSNRQDNNPITKYMKKKMANDDKNKKKRVNTLRQEGKAKSRKRIDEFFEKVKVLKRVNTLSQERKKKVKAKSKKTLEEYFQKAKASSKKRGETRVKYKNSRKRSLKNQKSSRNKRRKVDKKQTRVQYWRDMGFTSQGLKQTLQDGYGKSRSSMTVTQTTKTRSNKYEDK